MELPATRESIHSHLFAWANKKEKKKHQKKRKTQKTNLAYLVTLCRVCPATDEVCKQQPDRIMILFLFSFEN